MSVMSVLEELINRQNAIHEDFLKCGNPFYQITLDEIEEELKVLGLESCAAKIKIKILEKEIDSAILEAKNKYSKIIGG
jgi:hypothetical protein